MSVRTQKMIVPSNCSLKDCASRSLPRAEARCAHPAGYDSLHSRSAKSRI